MAAETKYSVGFSFNYDTGSKGSKTFSDVPHASFISDAYNTQLKNGYPLIVAGSATKYKKTTTVTEDLTA